MPGWQVPEPRSFGQGAAADTKHICSDPSWSETIAGCRGASLPCSAAVAWLPAPPRRSPRPAQALPAPQAQNPQQMLHLGKAHLAPATQRPTRIAPMPPFHWKAPNEWRISRKASRRSIGSLAWQNPRRVPNVRESAYAVTVNRQTKESLKQAMALGSSTMPVPFPLSYHSRRDLESLPVTPRRWRNHRKG